MRPNGMRYLRAMSHISRPFRPQIPPRTCPGPLARVEVLRTFGPGEWQPYQRYSSAIQSPKCRCPAAHRESHWGIWNPTASRFNPQPNDCPTTRKASLGQPPPSSDPYRGSGPSSYRAAVPPAAQRRPPSSTLGSGVVIGTAHARLPEPTPTRALILLKNLSCAAHKD